MFKKFFNLTLLLALTAAVGWSAYQMAVITYKKYTLEQQIQTLKAQAEALEGKHRDLTAFLDSFKDPAMLEQQLKRRLNVKKQGEEVVVLVPPDGTVTADEAVSSDELLANIATVALGTSENSPHWLKWWHYFFAP